MVVPAMEVNVAETGRPCANAQFSPKPAQHDGVREQMFEPGGCERDEGPSAGRPRATVVEGGSVAFVPRGYEPEGHS